MTRQQARQQDNKTDRDHDNKRTRQQQDNKTTRLLYKTTRPKDKREHDFSDYDLDCSDSEDEAYIWG